jgi:hypothetical protein
MCFRSVNSRRIGDLQASWTLMACASAAMPNVAMIRHAQKETHINLCVG